MVLSCRQISPREINKYPIIKSISLPIKVKETSGLIVHNQFIWTFNDSGGKAELYKIDPSTGQILHTLEIENAKNKDWEDITLSKKHLYISDTGNNKGKRRKLTIYKIKLSELNQESTKAEILTFTFPDQPLKRSKEIPTDFDCESLIFYQDKLHIFTKQKNSFGTSHYSLSPTEKEQEAKKINSFALGYLATGTSIEKTKKGYLLTFIGYNEDGEIFLSQIKGTDSELFNPLAEKRKTIKKIGEMKYLGQTEGVFTQKNKIYLTAEQVRFLEKSEPKLHLLDSFATFD